MGRVGAVCESTATSLGESICSARASWEGQVNSPALKKPKKPVQKAAQSLTLSELSLDPRPSDLCILMEDLVRDDHIEVEPT